MPRTILVALLFLLASAAFPRASWAEAPRFVITPAESSIKFSVKASVAIAGTFDKWNATLTFASPDISTGVLDVEIQAASVDTGSGMKNATLRSEDFFNADHDPFIRIADRVEVTVSLKAKRVSGPPVTVNQ